MERSNHSLVTEMQITLGALVCEFGYFLNDIGYSEELKSTASEEDLSRLHFASYCVSMAERIVYDTGVVKLLTAADTAG
jgi:hypothetical protein